jgi:hypothetical protein
MPKAQTSITRFLDDSRERYARQVQARGEAATQLPRWQDEEGRLDALADALRDASRVGDPAADQAADAWGGRLMAAADLLKEYELTDVKGTDLGDCRPRDADARRIAVDLVRTATGSRRTALVRRLKNLLVAEPTVLGRVCHELHLMLQALFRRRVERLVVDFSRVDEHAREVYYGTFFKFLRIGGLVFLDNWPAWKQAGPRAPSAVVQNSDRETDGHIVKQGRRLYCFDGREAVAVTQPEDCVLVPFIKNPALSLEQLKKKSGITHAAKVLKQIAERYPGAASAITFPGKSKRGYHVRISEAGQFQ